MSQLLQMFLLKELHGWKYETALAKCLQQQSSLCRRLDIEPVPDQSTLWRSWNYRFTTKLRDTIKTAARTVLLQADRADVSVPREPPDTHPHYQCDESGIDERSVLECAKQVTNHVNQIVYPGFSLDRGDACEIHENAFWDLQTHHGLRERLAANEGARSFVYESQRDRTPLGHTHREYLRNLSVERIRWHLTERSS